MKKRVIISALCAAAFAAIPALANVVVVGAPPDAGTGNSYPFGDTYNGEYQQVYNSGQFSGTQTINGL